MQNDVETQHNRMYSLYIGSLCTIAFLMARFTCIVTSQVFVEIWMRWSIALSSAFYTGRIHLWIVFSFKSTIIAKQIQDILINVTGNQHKTIFLSALESLDRQMKYMTQRILSIYIHYGCLEIFAHHYSLLRVFVFIGLKYWIRTWNSFIVYGNQFTSTVIKYVYKKMLNSLCKIFSRNYDIIIS